MGNIDLFHTPPHPWINKEVAKIPLDFYSQVEGSREVAEFLLDSNLGITPTNTLLTIVDMSEISLGIIYMVLRRALSLVLPPPIIH